jgi:ankyrin repeat protein
MLTLDFMATLHAQDALAVVVVEAIRGGDVAELRRLLDANPELAAARIVNERGGQRTLLHIVTDWPGYFPNGPAVVRLLIRAGADPNAPMLGPRPGETPLHWAASSDDVDVAESLIDGGADVEARGGSIAGGTPLDNAVGYGCWRVARLLVERGARVDKAWHAAALGMSPRLKELLASATDKELNEAFWQACHSGQRRIAEYLVTRGADLNFIPDYAKQTALEVAASVGTGREALIAWLREQGDEIAAQVHVCTATLCTCRDPRAHAPART